MANSGGGLKIYSVENRVGFPAASFFDRLLALLVDFVVMIVLLLLLKFSLHQLTSIQFLLASILLGLGYFAAPLVFFGRTLGKSLFSLRVVSIDTNKNPSAPTALLRETLGRLLSIIFFPGCLLPLFRRDHRSLHDLFAKTCVIYDGGAGWVFFKTIVMSLLFILILASSLLFAFYSQLEVYGLKIAGVEGPFYNGFRVSTLRLPLPSGSIFLEKLSKCIV